MQAITVDTLSKSYGAHQAVNNISFTISKGEVVGFLGPNGAGKSTTLKILTGFLSPTKGTAHINGINVLESPITAQQNMGYLPENAPLYPDMTVIEYLQYIANIRGMGKAEKQRAIEKISGQCQITERWHQPIGELSKGYRQRVGLAQALIHDPPIVVLDEPTTGLDPNQIVEMRNLIREIGKTKTVILSTHILSEVQVTCDRVLIIDKGQLVADGTVQEIISQSQSHLNWKVVVERRKVHLTATQIQDLLSNIEGIDRCAILPNLTKEELGFSISCSKDVRSSVFDCSVSNGLVLLELSPYKDDLESVFHRLTEGV
jgi:ABC-2 type transport system ATP-binding protein